MEILATPIVILVLVAILLLRGTVSVSQGQRITVERLGKFNRILEPGLNFIIPFIDRIAYRTTTKDIVLDIPSQNVISKDNASLTTNAVAYINIANAERAVYGIEDYEIAIQTLVQTSLRSILGEMKLDEALSSREQIKQRLKTDISEDISDWGITLKTVEIQDINPSGTMQAAMEEQAAAERARRAAVTRAEGEKASQILLAEGRLEASKRDGEAQIVLATASQSAIEKVTNAIKDNELPVYYILGEKYIHAMEELAKSPNSKTIVIPADIQATIKGILGKN